MILASMREEEDSSENDIKTQEEAFKTQLKNMQNNLVLNLRTLCQHGWTPELKEPGLYKTTIKNFKVRYPYLANIKGLKEALA